MSSNNNAGAGSCEGEGGHPFCQLPGDPSLILTTNVDLGAKKMEIMKACSKAISQHTGKPESYIGRFVELCEWRSLFAN